MQLRRLIRAAVILALLASTAGRVSSSFFVELGELVSSGQADAAVPASLNTKYGVQVALHGSSVNTA